MQEEEENFSGRPEGQHYKKAFDFGRHAVKSSKSQPKKGQSARIITKTMQVNKRSLTAAEIQNVHAFSIDGLEQ